MSDEARQNPSALNAWASKVMSGGKGTDSEKVGEVERAPGQAQYDPADVISVFMSAGAAGQQRHAQAPRPARRTAPRPAAAVKDEPQPS